MQSYTTNMCSKPILAVILIFCGVPRISKHGAKAFDLIISCTIDRV
jgi:hypothetical protein